MKEYTIVKKPNILDWTKIPEVQIDTHLQDQVVDISATGQVCYDNEEDFDGLDDAEDYYEENGGEW